METYGNLRDDGVIIESSARASGMDLLVAGCERFVVITPTVRASPQTFPAIPPRRSSNVLPEPVPMATAGGATSTAVVV